MRTRLIGLSMFAAALLGSSAASATPIIYIDGVGVPTGISPSGVVLSTETSYETLVTTIGQTLSGIFQVAGIKGTGPGFTYLYGDNSAFLHGVFDGFKLDAITPSGSDTKLYFTGGSYRYYVSATDTFTFDSGSQATNFANASAGTLWLDLKPATIDALGHTLVITVAGGDLTSFTSASALGWLDVVGGDAAYSFNTNGFSDNAFSTTGKNDVKFQGGANSGADGDYPVSGSNFVKANAVPEPMTLSLFGAGLAGAAALRRRKAKKA